MDKTKAGLLAEKRRLLESADGWERDGRPDIAGLQRLAAMRKGMEAADHPLVETGRTDGLGRAIRIDQVGRRVWRDEDWERPKSLKHLSADDWYRTRQCHGPFSC